MRVISTRFVLVGTQHVENVGAAARALKTMGFADLALASPRDPKVLIRHKAIQRASGATEVLRNASVCASLDEAVRGWDVVCGTGMPFDMKARRREGGRGYVEPRDFFEKLLATEEGDGEGVGDERPLRLALVFGSERTGMEESDMDKCHVMLGIPTNPSFSSLNLAAAVQIVAYDWRMAMGGSDSYGDVCC